MTREELIREGVTPDMARQWRDFYVQIAKRFPDNPSAPGRVKLMQWVLDVLSDQG